MGMKKWTSVGLVIMELNLALLGAARAAEMPIPAPAHEQEGWNVLGFRLASLWRNPPKATVAPVTVRLFSAYKLKTLWLKNSNGYRIASHKIKGTAHLFLQDGKIHVYQGNHRILVAERFRVALAEGDIIEARNHQGVRIWTHGTLNIRIVKDHIQVVNRLGIEDYVNGILEGELGSLHQNPEVMKAQIVVARSYVLSMRHQNHHGEGYEFCDRPHCQVFLGMPHDKDAEFEVALAKVQGEYLTYHDRPVAAFYHHNCGGMTSAIQDVWPAPPVPYLSAVSEPEGSFCRTSSKSRWSVRFSKKSLLACFQHAGWLKKRETFSGIKVVRTDRSGRVQRLMLQSHQPIYLTVGKFRNVLNQFYGGEPLKSALFTITAEGGGEIIRGRGWGHGIGFCQEGAKDLALHGKSYRSILLHYFPHTKLTKLN